MIRGEAPLFPAERVVIDECHVNTGDDAQWLMNAHCQNGAAIIGPTATPLGIGHLYYDLIVAGKNSELRDCGALVMARHYGPDEPDMAAWKKKGTLKGWCEGEDLSENQARKVMMTEGIFGRVGQSFERLNPGHLPTILFAPGVKESLWFAEQFHAIGITAAHIDGQDVWVNGKLHRTSLQAREDVLNGSREGSIKVVCNRFVLREGIDCPWLVHGIFATIFGSVQSYLQSGGRLLRSNPSLASVTIQDHGGNWWRHGSLNADREWRLDCTASIAHGIREDRLRLRGRKCVKCGAKMLPRRCQCVECGALNEIEPSVCPKCFQVINGPRCPCGWEAGTWKPSRRVVGTDGVLKEMTGDIFKPRSVCKRPDGPARWARMYYRSKTAKGRRTFKAAAALFARENYFQYPDRSWPLMPIREIDWYSIVEDVPAHLLIQKEVTCDLL